jgi:hypothetical protein
MQIVLGKGLQKEKEEKKKEKKKERKKERISVNYKHLSLQVLQM